MVFGRINENGVWRMARGWCLVMFNGVQGTYITPVYYSNFM